ncbi:MAG: ferrous iron transporter B [Clostridiales bacterium]|nr:ferrous iron transporter B [Clostridiales bacterium]
MSEVLIVGTPNSGKSTLFNALTKGNVKVGNWHGVTVDTVSKPFTINEKTYLLTDTPGIYSLNPLTLEEKVTLSKIKEFNGIMVFVTDFISYPFAITSVLSLYNKGFNVILAVNFLKEFEKNGGIYNKDIVKSFPFPIILSDFNTKLGVSLIKNEIYNYQRTTAYYDKNALVNFIEVPPYKKEKIDKMVLSSKLSWLFVLASVIITFYISFGSYGIGGILSSLLSYGFEKLYILLERFLISVDISLFIKGLILDGIFSGLSSVLTFLPQMLVLGVVLTFIEQSGIMARIAFITESFLYSSGLNGRAVFSALMGFGCTAVAINYTGGLESEKERKRASLLCSGINCLAKLPIFLFFSTLPCVKYPFFYITGVYLFSIMIVFVRLFVTGNLIVKGKRAPLIMELPPYRLCKGKDLYKSLLNNLKQFIIKIATVIFLISVATYLLSSLSFDLSFVSASGKDSILSIIGKALTPLLYPLGVRDWKVTQALISGLFAKEAILSTLITLYPEGVYLSFETVITLTAFIIIYPPCIVALSQVKRVAGKKFTIIYVFILIVEAYLISLILRLII